MASDYGLNFGFRRSDESVRVSEGRFRTPTDADLMLGTCVEIDPANEGYLRQGAADVAARPGICGLLVQEEFDFSIYESSIYDSFDLGVAKRGRLSVVTNGPGTKVWFKNTPQHDRADGRTVPARTLVADVAGLSVGDALGWDGTQWAAVDGVDVNEAHMEVVHTNGVDAVEATLLR